MRSFRRFALAAVVSALAVSSAGVLRAQTSAPSGNAVHGGALFVAQGCYECHGYQGQGTGRRAGGQDPGPNIAPAPIAYGAFVAQLRHPRVVMPPYDAVLLSDADVADIYAYLSSVPAAKDPHAIALLATVNTGSSAGASRGRDIYAANCATCHGANGSGGNGGPSLMGERTRKGTDAAIAFIKNPAPPMTKLYPGMLDEADVAAVTAYVESLH